MNDDPTTEAVPSGTLDDAPEATFTLRVVDGPERGATYGIGGMHPARVVVGTGPLSEVRFTGRRVSRKHVAFAVENGALVATDLGSKNGTWIGTLRVREVELHGGEQLTIGDAAVAIERGPIAPAALSATDRFGGLLGKSREMRRLFPLLEKLAATTIPVVLQGEPGTGKELLAESLHAVGPRRDGPFVVVDSAGMPGSHLEQALAGAFEAAIGGTLFLKDVAELDLSFQARLLRALERTVTDVRLVVATRRDLDREVQVGRFRDDLFHRLAVARVELPPLRKRPVDVTFLAAPSTTSIKVRVRSGSTQCIRPRYLRSRQPRSTRLRGCRNAASPRARSAWPSA